MYRIIIAVTAFMVFIFAVSITTAINISDAKMSINLRLRVNTPPPYFHIPIMWSVMIYIYIHGVFILNGEMFYIRGGDYTLRAAGLTTVLRLQVTEEASLRFNSYRSLNNY